MSSLDSDFQRELEPMSVDPKPQPLEPFSEIFTFSEIVHSTLDCSARECTVNKCHRAMLKIGKYKHELENDDSWHLCVFLAPPSSKPRWCETAMYRAKGRRCVNTTKWLRCSSTDTTTAWRLKCPLQPERHRAKLSNTDRVLLVDGKPNLLSHTNAYANCLRLAPTQMDLGA
jgi:hypothetical protein